MAAPDQRQLHGRGGDGSFALLRSGALPAPLTIIEERSVGPNLGSDSIRYGPLYRSRRFGLVVVLMVVLYGAWGMIANVGLVLHTIIDDRRTRPDRVDADHCPVSPVSFSASAWPWTLTS